MLETYIEYKKLKWESGNGMVEILYILSLTKYLEF